MRVKVHRLHPAAGFPSLVHTGDVGYDLYLLGDHVVKPGERKDLPLGIAIEMSDDIYGRITGRSSSTRRGLHVAEGIIDSGYRGPLFAYVVNQTDQDMPLQHGIRLAQMVFAPAIRPALVEVHSLASSDRDTRGLGSTGI